MTTISSQPTFSIPPVLPRGLRGSTNSADRLLLSQIHRALEVHTKLPELLASLSQLMIQHSDCRGLWFAGLNQGELQPWRVLWEPATSATRGPDPAGWQAAAASAIQSGEVQILSPAASDRDVQIIAPILGEGRPLLLLAGSFSVEQQSETRPAWLISSVALAIELWHHRRQIESWKGKATSGQQPPAFLKSIATADSSTGVAIAIANHLKRTWGATQVLWFSAKNAVSSGSSRWQLAAISDLEGFDRSSESVIKIEAWLTPALEAWQKTAPTLPCFIPAAACGDPAADSAEPVVSLPTELRDQIGKSLERQSAGAVYCWEARIGDQSVGVAVAFFPESLPGMAGQLGNWQVDQGETLSLQIQLATAAVRSPGERIRKRFAQCWRTRTRRLIATAVVASLIALVIPFPFRLHCQTQVQPVSRRFLSAPYAGTLEKTWVKSGDRVTEGQLLATLDASPLRIQLAGLQAELAGATKKRDQALAQKDIAESQIQKSEMQRIQAELQLLEKRLAEVEIRSPLAGVIVSGDWDQAEGATLQLGQNLFEIGPLERLLVEVLVPESDIRFVAAEQAVQIKFAAYPFRTWQGTISRVHPRSEVIDQQNVFVAEVEIENEAGELQPGMKGTAKVRRGWAPLGWLLFRGVWDDFRYWWVW